jgi:uncharacterized protein (TIGR02246 family)
MKRMNLSLALLGAAATALLIGGCDKVGGGKSDPAAVQSAIKADEKKWNEDFKSKNLEGLLSHYSDDAYFVAPGVQATGATAIRKAYADALSDNYFSISFASDKIDVAASGDLAYSRGHFSEKHEDQKAAKIVTDSGSYLTVYKKQADGSWKAVEDFAAADPTKTKSEPVVAKPPKMISF